MFIDIIAICILLFFATFGLMKGFMAQLSAVAAIVLAFILSKPATPATTKLLSSLFGTSFEVTRSAAPWVAGFLVFILVLLMGLIIQKSIIRPIATLSFLDRLTGVVISLMQGILVVVIGMFFIHKAPKAVIQKWVPKVYDSYTYQMSQAFFPSMKKQIWQKKHIHPVHPDVELAPSKKIEDVIGEYLEEENEQE